MKNAPNPASRGDGSSEQFLFGVDVDQQTARPHPDRLELERAVERQRHQLEAAVSMLQEAAHLAGYHQPGLAREIRDFLDEIKG